MRDDASGEFGSALIKGPRKGKIGPETRSGE